MSRRALTADDVPAEIDPNAALARCPEHPDAQSLPGFGYKGGGFGPYRSCYQCGDAFAKQSAKDGNA